MHFAVSFRGTRCLYKTQKRLCGLTSMHIDYRLIWSTRHVKRKLTERNISDRATFYYFFAIFVFDWFQFSIGSSVPALFLSPWALAGTWLSFATTIGGLLYLFSCNGKSGEQFLPRYLPLSVTVGWKFLITSLVLTAVIDATLSTYGRAVVGWANTGVLTALNLTMFWRIGEHLRDLTRISS
ncbi:hypothetical protein X961_4208 [Burkholderia pseudomallei MSHR5613]|nr:hypothetical protein X961_4208 [Burkholderia pseudomallei MSHR5613]